MEGQVAVGMETKTEMNGETVSFWFGGILSVNAILPQFVSCGSRHLAHLAAFIDLRGSWP